MARPIALIYAHPYPNRSRAGRALLSAVSDLECVEVRSLYERYPDFSIDVAAEQSVLASASLIIWQHPVFWYGAPPLLSLWFEKVLARGWAYGKGGSALHDKACLWVPTTGGAVDAYRPGGMHGQRFEAFSAPFEQTARFCGMRWEAPLVLHGSQHASDETLHARGVEYRARLEPYRTMPSAPPTLSSDAEATP
jgi:glutathione-regulated potassium-efflux system ancillary protein KefF